MSSPAASAEYEFDAAQNTMLGDLSSKMRFVGLILIIVGALSLVGGILATVRGGGTAALSEGITSLISGVLYAIVGVWTRKAAASFQQIVDTEGQDIINLSSALAELLKLYTLEFWIMVIALVLFVVGAIAGAAGASL